MKKILFFLLCITLLNISYSQISKGGEPISLKMSIVSTFEKITIEKVDQDWKDKAVLEELKNGSIEKVAKNFYTDINPYNTGSWETLTNGDRLWRLQITAEDALGINTLFKDFYLAKGSKLYIYNPQYTQIIGAFDETNNHDSKLFATEIIFGNTLILEYLEPKEEAFKGFFTIEKVGSFFKSVEYGMNATPSGSCEINVNCSPEGVNWQDEKRGVARVLVEEGGSSGWCTGSLVNNTNLDCKPYFLTALHCGQGSTTSDFNQYVFYFNYEYAGCSNSGAATTTQTMTGGALKAKSNVLNSSTVSSDFMLLELNQPVPSSYNPYFNGWDVSAGAASSGVGIHHPAGDVKKISTYTGSLTSIGVWMGASYNVAVGVTHWQVFWNTTTNGTGVTEGGSSGSPLFNSSGLVVGTLSGGGSGCSSMSSPDQYGKMSYHWESNSTANNRMLKPWLDPANTGATTLSGTYAPCSITTSDDAGITAIVEPTGTSCGLTINPIITLKNFGTTNLTSVTISQQINSGTIISYSWSGNLIQNATIDVIIPSSTVASGTNTYTAFTTNPNGNADGNNLNNSTTENFIINSVSTLPLQQDFESSTFPPTNWGLVNSDNDLTWEHATTIGTGTGTKSMFIDNWDYDNLNTLDWFVSDFYDFSSISNPTLTYDHAYTYYLSGSTVSYDTLGIAASTDCGETFYWLWKEGGVQLATTGALNTEFVPTSSDWQNNSLDLSSLVGESSVQIAFIAKTGYGNNLYVDNINIFNTVVSTPPVSEFTSDVTSSCIPAVINFTDQSTNTPTSWLWDFGNGTTSNLQNPTITYNTEGTFTVSLTATNTYGSSTETKTNFISTHSNPVLTLTPTNISCFNGNDGSILTNVTGNGGYTYSWVGSSSTSASISSVIANTYSCTVTDLNGCTANTSTVLTQPMQLTASVNTTTAYCGNSNGFATISISGGESPYNTAWSQGGGMNLEPNNYSVTVTDDNNCILTENFTIDNTEENFTITVQTTNSSCIGNTGTASASVGGSISGYTFLWDGVETTTSVTGLSFGVHQVTLTNANGCSETTSFNIENLNAPSINLNTTNISCFGQNDGSATVSITGGTTPYNITWSSSSNTGETENNLGPNSYILTVEDDASCISSNNFTISEPDAISISFTTIDEHCDQEDGKVTAIVSGGTLSYTYSWNNSASGNINNNIPEGLYTLNITDGNDCLAQASTNIINIAGPEIQNPIITDLLCANENNGQILIDVINGTGTYIYNWSNGSHNEDLTNVSGGNYTITVIDEFSCEAEQSFEIEEPSPLIIDLTVIDNSTSGTSSMIANVSGGTQMYNYLWSNGDTTQTISDLDVGFYSITVTDANNCEIDTSASIGKVAIQNVNQIENIEVFPNPTNSFLNLEIELKNLSNIDLIIYSVLGKVIYSNELLNYSKGKEIIDVSQFADGLYFIEIKIDDHKEIYKFIKAN